jgi:hypothetical protein
MRQFVPDGLRFHVTCFANMREIVTQLAHCQRRWFTAHVERIVHLEMPVVVVVLEGALGVEFVAELDVEPAGDVEVEGALLNPPSPAWSRSAAACPER